MEMLFVLLAFSEGNLPLGSDYIELLMWSFFISMNTLLKK